MSVCAHFLFGPGTERLQSSLTPGDSEQHYAAKLALSVLSFDHDRLYVERVGTGEWRVDCWDRERCEPCDGVGRDPERDPRACRHCDGTGRDRRTELSLSRVYVLDLDGELRPVESTEARAA